MSRYNELDVQGPLVPDFYDEARHAERIDQHFLARHDVAHRDLREGRTIGLARPGIGRLIVDAILNKDFPVVQGAVLLTATVYLLVNLLTDISYSLIDPRIRY